MNRWINLCGLLLAFMVSCSLARADAPKLQPFLFGGDYPSQPSDAVKSLFYETGMNCIRLTGGGYGWSVKNHQKLADEFQARGLYVYTQLGSHYPSGDYFGAKDTYFVDQNGATGVEDRKTWAITYDGEHWPQLSYGAADQFFPHMERDFTAYLSHFADDHNIRGMILHNEAGLFWLDKRLFDYNPATIAKFRAWLPTQHPDIAMLNTRWGTAFDSFAVVDPPKQLPPYKEENAAAWMDWRRFQVVVIADFMQREAEFAAKVRPDVPRTTNLPGPLDNWYGYRLSDIFAFSKPMDAVGIDIYPAVWSDRVFVPYAMDMTQGTAQGRPANVLECEVFSAQNWKGMSEAERAGMLQGELWTMIGHGARTVLMWGFNRGDNFSLTDGKFNDRVRVCRDIAHITKMIGIDHFARPKAKIAMCVDPDDYIYASGIEPTPRSTTSALDAHVHGVYAALADAHLPVDVMETPQLTDEVAVRYSVIVLADASMMDAALAARLQKFVNDGGTLVAVGSLAQKDRWGHALDIVPGYGLDKLFGLIGAAVDPGNAFWANQRYTVRGAEVLEPGFTCNAVGKGKAYLIDDEARNAAMKSGDRMAFAKQMYQAVSATVPTNIVTQSSGKDAVNVSSLADGSGNMLLVASTLGSAGELPPVVGDLKLTINDRAKFQTAYTFPPTAISDGMIRSGPRWLVARAGTTTFDIGTCASSLPILFAESFSPLLAIKMPAQAKPGDDIEVWVTCFNPSAAAFTGELALQLPNGLTDAAGKHSVTVPDYSELPIACTVHVAKEVGTTRAVINAVLTGAKISPVAGIPVDLQIAPE